jgi:GNAT superfamily N-acetyltransferase
MLAVYHGLMRIRQATIEDLDTIIDHRLSMFREMGHNDPRELNMIERISREYFEKAIPSDAFHAVLAEVDSSIVGGGGVVVAPWPGGANRLRPQRSWILNVYVHRQHRRRGIARTIMKTLIQWSRSQGFDCVCLHASDDGRPLYQQLGFKPTNEMRLDLNLGITAAEPN